MIPLILWSLSNVRWHEKQGHILGNMLRERSAHMWLIFYSLTNSAVCDRDFTVVVLFCLHLYAQGLDRPLVQRRHSINICWMNRGGTGCKMKVIWIRVAIEMQTDDEGRWVVPFLDENILLSNNPIFFFKASSIYWCRLETVLPTAL